MIPTLAVIALGFAGIDAWTGYTGDSLPTMLLVIGGLFVALLPLIWLRWFVTGAELRTRRGLLVFALCLLWAAAASRSSCCSRDIA